MRLSSRWTADVAARVAVIAALAAVAMIAVACGPDSIDDGPVGGQPAAPDEVAPAGAESAEGEGQQIHGDFDVGPDPEEVAEAQPSRADPELTARTASGAQTTQAEHPEDPVAVSVPAIGVDSELVRLGLNQDRSMEVPANFDLAGWYIHSPRPGDAGPAVIAGHVSSSAGPGVFYRLRDLEPGQEIHVTRDDGARVTFTVDRLEQYPKEQVPTDEVYGSTGGEAELRLITCAGDFDRRERRHRDNIVVFASQA